MTSPSSHDSAGPFTFHLRMTASAFVLSCLARRDRASGTFRFETTIYTARHLSAEVRKPLYRPELLIPAIEYPERPLKVCFLAFVAAGTRNWLQMRLEMQPLPSHGMRLFPAGMRMSIVDVAPPYAQKVLV